MRKLLFTLCFIFLLLNRVYATPNNSISISPSATDNTVITSSDENTRNSEVSSKFNAHDHTDISQTGNTLSIGSGVAGDKTINANNADTNKPFMAYYDTLNKWVFSADGGLTGASIHSNAVYIHGNAAVLIIGQPDGGCSSCGVDAAGTTWSCSDISCPN